MPARLCVQGGTARLAGVVMSLALALGVVAAAPLLAAVPIGSLVGLMLVVCHSTFSWSSLRLIGRIPPIDTAVLAVVSVARPKASKPRQHLRATYGSHP